MYVGYLVLFYQYDMNNTPSLNKFHMHIRNIELVICVHIRNI